MSDSKITIKGTHPQVTEVFINGERIGLPIVRVHVDIDARQPKMNTVYIEAHVDEVELLGAVPEHVVIPLPRPASEGETGV